MEKQFLNVTPVSPVATLTNQELGSANHACQGPTRYRQANHSAKTATRVTTVLAELKKKKSARQDTIKMRKGRKTASPATLASTRTTPASLSAKLVRRGPLLSTPRNKSAPNALQATLATTMTSALSNASLALSAAPIRVSAKLAPDARLKDVLPAQGEAQYQHLIMSALSNKTNCSCNSD